MKTRTPLIRLFTCILFLFALLSGYGQDTADQKSKKGLYLYWGWNRAAFTNSDIHFTGNEYDFTLEQVQAKDRQSPFGYDPYFHPQRLSIPQTNFRLGYFLGKNIDISFGLDHMKYVITNGQTVSINGHISTPDSLFNGEYTGDEIEITSEFLQFEHTDGLNYGNLELTKNFLPLQNFGKLENRLELLLFAGAGGGLVIPRSNVSLMSNERYDEFHLAGFGFAAKVGFQLNVYKYLLLRMETKGGWIDMPSIRTTASKSDKGSQNFGYIQSNFVFGIFAPIGK